jgi:transcriptional regulator with XRE-family HTH domain
MARKRVVNVDGNKIAKARAETKLDQESFARKAGVSVRTLQRAEKSDMISPNKIAQIAGELRVNSEELIQKESPATTNSDRNDGYGNLSLKPVRSHKDIQKLCLSHSAEFFNLDYQISPQPELVEKVAAVIKDIQAWIEFEASGRGEGIEWGDPFDYAAQFKKDMEFTQILRDLWDGGIFLFAGHYTYRVLRWTEIPTGEYENRWLSESKRVAVLRFFDEKST